MHGLLGARPGIPKGRQYDANVSPPASPGDTGNFGTQSRASGSGRLRRSLQRALGKVRRPPDQGALPVEALKVGLPEDRKALIHRYMIDAEQAEAEAPRAPETLTPKAKEQPARPVTLKPAERRLAAREATRQTAAAPQTAEVTTTDTAPPAAVAAVATATRAWTARRIEVATLSALLALSSAVGLVLVSAADALSRSGQKHGGLLFWLGLLAIFVPVTARLTSTSPTRNERVGLLALLGLASYLVKVFRDPFRFLYADEFVHQYNVLSILETHGLFRANPVLPATPAYPGLEAPTAALSAMTGMSMFASGLVVIAAARLIMMLALFLLYEIVTGSGRVAGLAAALYAASPHYLFFVADFSYESLALPIAILALAAALRARPPTGAGRRAWLIVALILTAGVVVTHHMTSYALIATLLAICLVPLPWLPRQPRRPWMVAVAVIALTAGWLVLSARKTVGYLSPVFLGALRETIRTVQGESQVRELFRSSGGAQGPAWEHYVAFASALLVAVSLPFGFRAIWRHYRHLPAPIVFAVAALAYLATLGLRLVPAAWAIAARASEFLFIGSALVLALFALWVLERFPNVAARAGLVVAAAVLIIGGVISTTPSSTRLAQPYRVSVRGADVVPQAAAVGQWAREALGAGNRVAAGAADGLFLLLDGRQHVFNGSNPPIPTILETKTLYPWEISVLRRYRIRYVVTDRQPSGTDIADGYYFFRDKPDNKLALGSLKFQRAGAGPIYDSGNIVVYDLLGPDSARRRGGQLR